MTQARGVPATRARGPRGSAGRALRLLLPLGFIACQSGAGGIPGYAVTVLVDGPSGSLSAVPVLRDGTPLGTTAADGRLTVRLRGAEGDVARVSVTCPPGHEAPPAPTPIPLYRLTDPERPPLYRVACRRNVNTVVVAVRATNGPHLPVLYLGKEVARTDESGAAHVGLELPPGERFELTLDTRGAGSERLRPANPTAVFVAKGQDELVFFDQRFDAPKPRGGGRPGPRRF